MSLDFSFLESPIPKERQEKIIALLWGPSQRYREQYFHAYFEYYTEQCRCIYLCYEDELSVRKHQHIIDVAERIRKGGSRSEIKDFIQKSEWASGAGSDKGVYASIDLTARLIGMVDVGEFENAYTGRPKLLWTEGSFADFMQETFSDSIFLESEGLKLNGGFIMVNMMRIAGFKLEPTSNLCNHLRLRDADQTIEFFHHSSFLMASRQ